MKEKRDESPAPDAAPDPAENPALGLGIEAALEPVGERDGGPPPSALAELRAAAS